MNRLSRDSWLALLFFVLLTAVTAVAVAQETLNSVDQPALAAFSEEPEGARAFWLYLEEVGYEPTDAVQTSFQIPEDTHLFLMLEPGTNVTDEEWEVIDEWVDEGGTLLLAGWNFLTGVAMGHYDTRLRLSPERNFAVVQQTPLMVSPALPAAAPLENDYYLQTDRSDFVTHFAGEENGLPVIISFPQAEGRVILSAMPQVFTNQGLKVEGHAELAMNVVQAVEEARVIWFDEWHHGIRPEATAGNNWLQRTPAGRALLYVGLVLFVGLVLRGRLFGRPVPVAQDSRRRLPLEYISGIANLNRRAGHRTAVLQDYHDRLKRELGGRYRLNPTLPDEEFVLRLATYNPNVDTEALLKLLSRLSQSRISEQEMIELAAEAARFGQDRKS